MSQRFAALTLALTLPAAVAGCAARPGATPAPSESRYLTVGPDPRRDTAVAAREDEAALALMAAKDYAGAEAALRRALAADVMFGPAHNNLGLVYFRRSELYLAAWEFQYAVKLMPSQPEPRNNLGLVFETSGKLDPAVESFGAAVKLEPDNPQFVGNLARARVRRGDGGDDVRGLLQKVAAADTRPEWVDWARERLALFKRQPVEPGQPPAMAAPAP